MTSGRDPMPDTEPDIFATCDAGNCNAPATTRLHDDVYGWLPACRFCAREARS